MQTRRLLELSSPNSIRFEDYLRHHHSMKWPSSLGKTLVCPRGTCTRGCLCHYLLEWCFKLPSSKPLILSSLFSIPLLSLIFPKLISLSYISSAYFTFLLSLSPVAHSSSMSYFTASLCHHRMSYLPLSVHMADHAIIRLLQRAADASIRAFLKPNHFF